MGLQILYTICMGEYDVLTCKSGDIAMTPSHFL